MHTQHGFLPRLPILIIATVIVIGAAGYIALYTNHLSSPKPMRDELPTKPTATITSFEECAAAGYPIQESYPRRCTSPDLDTFVEVITSDASCAAILCPAGSTCENGKCVEPNITNPQDPCMYTKCAAGYRCQAGTGKCLKIDPCFMMDCFEPGTTCIEGRCVKKNPAN